MAASREEKEKKKKKKILRIGHKLGDQFLRIYI